MVILINNACDCSSSPVVNRFIEDLIFYMRQLNDLRPDCSTLWKYYLNICFRCWVSTVLWQVYTVFMTQMLDKEPTVAVILMIGLRYVFLLNPFLYPNWLPSYFTSLTGSQNIGSTPNTNIWCKIVAFFYWFLKNPKNKCIIAFHNLNITIAYCIH